MAEYRIRTEVLLTLLWNKCILHLLLVTQKNDAMRNVHTYILGPLK